MQKWDEFDRRNAKSATDGVLKLCSDLPRLDRALAALNRLSGGVLPAELSPLCENILWTRKKLMQVSERFRPRACKVEQRLRTNFAEVIGPLCDELEGLVVEYYTVAKFLYNLPELDCRRANK